jgi:hypothetical protein
MRSLNLARTFFLVGLAMAAASQAVAQGFDTLPPAADARFSEEYTSTPYVQTTAPSYESNAVESTARTVQQQNAQTRGQQRQLRLASMAWYGMSNSRPTASPTPFASMYSPAWQMPGGRPFAWSSFNRPTYLIYR